MAAAAVGVVSASSEIESAFLGYITQYGKSYSSVAEYEHRFEQFARNHLKVIAHNQTQSQYTLGHNKMSDWTEAEYKAMLTHEPMPESEKNYEYHPEPAGESNGTIDWRNKGAVNAIKDQGQCGSCWAFSSVCAMEGAHKVSKGKLESFAEQQLVDCSTANYGCNGGWQYKAFSWYKSHSAEYEANYKYTARNGNCKSSQGASGVKASGYTNVAANNVSQMKAALAKSVLSVSIEADQYSFQAYRSGIFNSSSCGTSLDHATNVVGWGSSGSTDYWIMRNSWGTSWGEKGYMRL
jgi:cathepsin L